MDLGDGTGAVGAGPRWARGAWAVLLVAAAAFLAYVPVLDADFIELDDDRFVRDNPAVHELDLEQAARYFTDPSTLAAHNWRGTYRPLRTLDFAIDWAVSGGRPWLFHLRNVLYHVLGSLLVLALFRRLSPGAGRASVFGALLFAVHPVQTEAVAWVTSRGDTLLLVTFLGALLLHVSGRRIAAALVLVLALLSKESAAVFPAVALVVDRYRREPLRFGCYGVYAGLVGAYAVLWYVLQAAGHGPGQGFGHMSEWWGGSYGANLLTAARGLLHYAGVVVLPVRQVLDYLVTVTTGLDLAAALGIGLVLLAALGAWRGGPRTRLSVLWFAITLFPMMSILYSVATPSTERFLYLPMVGLCFLAGHLFARTRLAWIPLLCLLLLTLSRCRDWKDHDRLMEATRAAAITQMGQLHLAYSEFHSATEALERGDHDGMRRHAEAVIRASDELFEAFRVRVGRPPTGPILVAKWNALFILERYTDALVTAEEYVARGGGGFAHYSAAVTLAKLGREEKAGEQAERAVATGFDRFDIRGRGATYLNAAARKREAAEEWEAALGLYRRSVAILPDRHRNAEAWNKIGRPPR